MIKLAWIHMYIDYIYIYLTICLIIQSDHFGTVVKRFEKAE